MTPAQGRALPEMLGSYRGVTPLHGDGVGSDAQAHDIAVGLGCTVVIHPYPN
jgi:hypothetical protein